VSDVNKDQAMDAAVVAFLQIEDDGPVRERLRAAVAAHQKALTTCPACQGAGKLVVRSEGTVWTSGRYRDRPADRAVSAGQEMPCVCCDGSGLDRDQMVWACAAPYRHCQPNDGDNEDHRGCGWSLRVQTNSPSQPARGNDVPN